MRISRVLIVVFSILLLAPNFSGCSLFQKREQNRAADGEYYRDDPEAKYEGAGAEGTATNDISVIGQPRKRAVVFDFWNSSPIEVKGVERFSAEELKRGLSITEKVIIAQEAQSVMSTGDFVTRSGDVRVAQLIREARRLGVQVAIIGRVAKITYRQKGDEVGVFRRKSSIAAADVEVKIFDVTGGREITAVGRSGEASSTNMATFEADKINDREFRGELVKYAIRDAIRRLVPQVGRSVQKMEWEGRVAKMIGTKVYLNSGRKSGLISGDILKVLTQGDEIYDPGTGAFLGKTPGRLKGTLEVVDFVGEDAAVAVLHTGGQIEEGDVVRLY